MSRSEPIKIEYKPKKINAEFVYEGNVTKNGNGASIHSFKKFIGKKATIIIQGDEKMDDNKKLKETAEFNESFNLPKKYTKLKKD